MLTTAQSIVLITLVLFATIQLIYIVFVFGKLAIYEGSVENDEDTQGVSVIVAARNELRNLKQHLHKVLNQNYRLFEVIVVNDGSDDGSKEWLDKTAKGSDKLHIIHRTLEQGSKKNAISAGIQQAKFPLLLFIDADCYPNSNDWISYMCKHLQKNSTITLGFGPYIKQKGLLNKLIRFDTVMIAINYFSYALNKIPYMGVGRNLAYTKALWEENSGFDSHKHIKSGDDDLFVSETATNSNTSIELNEKAFTYSISKSNFGEWLNQKARHLSTYRHYSSKTKKLLNLYNISYLGFFLMLICSFFVTLDARLPVLIYLMRLIPLIIVLSIAMNRLKEKDLIFLTPILEFALLLIYPLIILKSSTNKTIIWK